MSGDSHLFRTYIQLVADGWELRDNIFYQGKKRCLPLYEGKMISQYDSRFSCYTLTDKPESYELDVTQHKNSSCLAIPRYWVHEMHVPKDILSKRVGLLGFRDVTNNTNMRTTVINIIPATPCGHKLPLVVFDTAHINEMLYFNSCCSSFAFDYVARQKIGGTSMSYFILKQLPVLPPDTYEVSCAWNNHALLGNWICSRALELTYTAWDLHEFARECGYDGPPFRWDEERRFLLRCELDAAYFHLYGIARDDVDYIMETFPIVKRKDEKAFGEYRTKRVILEMYDSMAYAIETGTAYETRLSPPPSSALVVHPAEMEAYKS